MPVELESTFTGMGEIATGMADRLAEHIIGDAADAFAELEDTDEAVDALHTASCG